MMHALEDNKNRESILELATKTCGKGQLLQSHFDEMPWVKLKSNSMNDGILILLL